ncbi:unnamed protein product [Miscanthus lutarioriparius]|uniref:Chlorophyll synthase n=1 Tax=Miscanthus lutarioriparius TaxID=422564 RepID=A0A811RS34_9POAL|nr:unnamed protein product [Miscanthus lutarioriparius]
MAAAAASSSSTAFRPPLRLRSPPHPPHLRFNRTGKRLFPVVRAAETDAKDTKANAKAPEKAPATDGSSFNQDIWKIRLQLTKPVTWPPLVWGVLCGAAASGNFHWTVEDVAKSIVCMIMSGPCLTGYTQTLNDWYDRDIDAINEPYRPIPWDAISENEVITQIWVLLLGGLGFGALLDVWAGHDFPIVFYLAVGGSLLSYIYSAPPLKLGIAIVNDFKSIEGDRTLGLQSLPVAFGMETAKWICVGAIDITQLSVAGYLLSTGKLYYALVLLGLTIPQVFFQFQYFLKDPVKYDVKYQVCFSCFSHSFTTSDPAFPVLKLLASRNLQVGNSLR